MPTHMTCRPHIFSICCNDLQSHLIFCLYESETSTSEYAIWVVTVALFLTLVLDSD